MVSDRTKAAAGGGVLLLLLLGFVVRRGAAAETPPIVEPGPGPILIPEGPVMAQLGDIEASFFSKIGTSTAEDGRQVGAVIVNKSNEIITFHVSYVSIGPSGIATSRDSINLQLDPGEEFTVTFDDFFTEGRPAGTKYASTISFFTSSQDQTPILAPIMSNFIFR